MNEEITVQGMLKTFQKRWFFILLLTIVSVSIAAIISYFVITPIYEAETQILVNQKSYNNQQLIGAQNVDNDLQLINTYNVIIKSPAILSKVIDELSLTVTPEQLTKQINVSNANNSQVVDIRVQDKQAKKAVEIANTVTEVFKEEIPVLMHVDNVNILSSAKIGGNVKPIKPNRVLNMIVASIIGFIIAFLLAYFMETLDKTIKTERDIEEVLSLPVIGVVSKIKPEKDRSILTQKRARGSP